MITLLGDRNLWLRRCFLRRLSWIYVMLAFSGALAQGERAGQIEPTSEVWIAQALGMGKLNLNSEVSVIVETKSRNISVHRNIPGLVMRNCFDFFCTGQVRIPMLEPMAKSPAVRLVRVCGKGRPQGSTRLGQGAIEGDIKHTFAPKKVILAIIDHGISWQDPAFWNSFGNRILNVWDQTLPNTPSAQTLGVSYGTEINPANVERLRKSSTNVSGHGKHMALIAAGLSGPGTELGRLFANLQPNISVILVNTTGQEAEVLDAIHYITRKAREFGARYVINLSMSIQTGPHDGTDLFTRAMDSLLDENGLLVVSVGNEAKQMHYFHKSVADKESIPVYIAQKGCRQQDITAFELEGWYPSKMDLQVSIGPPGAKGSRLVPEGTVDGVRWSSGRALIDTRLASHDQAKQGFHISGEAPCTRRQKDLWNIEIRKTSTASMNLEMWMASVDKGAALFANSTASMHAISSLAASHNALVIGAYFFLPDRTVVPAGFSSMGATGDGRWKPDLLLAERMPGVDIVKGEGGATSAAAALASRCIADLWAKNPHCVADALRTLFKNKIILPNGPIYKPKGLTLYRPKTPIDLQKELGSGRRVRETTDHNRHPSTPTKLSNEKN